VRRRTTLGEEFPEKIFEKIPFLAAAVVHSAQVLDFLRMERRLSLESDFTPVPSTPEMAKPRIG